MTTPSPVGRADWGSLWTRTRHTGILEARKTRQAYRQFRAFLRGDERLIVEAGCGTGRFCHLIARDRPDATVVGVDVSIESLHLTRAVAPTPNLRLLLADIFQLPLPDGCVDFVFNEGVIEHFPAWESRSHAAVIGEMVRVLRPGGTLVIAVPNFYCLPHTLYKRWMGDRYEYGYERSFRARELKALLAAAGIGELKVRGFWPFHGISRLRARYPWLVIPLSPLGPVLDGLDRLTGDRFSRGFGYEIVVGGRKQ